MERAPLIRKKMKRWERPADSRFLTFSCYQRLPLFRNPRICDRFVERLNDCRYRLGFRLYAYVVMPEHVHLLLSVDRDGTRIPAILKDLKGGFAIEVLAAWRKLKAPVLPRITPPGLRPRFWQHGGGFDRNITTSEKFWEKLRYIHHNPVARGLVSNPAAWWWSSASWFTGGESPIWMDLDPRRDRWGDTEPSESELAMWKHHLDLRGEEFAMEE